MTNPVAGGFSFPAPQFRCWARLPQFLTPRDAVIYTGSPFTWLPEALWSAFQPGIDFEWLSFSPGYVPPLGQVVGWTFRFRFARMIAPLVLHDHTTILPRPGAIVQFANGNPPWMGRSNAPAYLVVGLWGGLLDHTKLAITPNPQTGNVEGMLEF